MRPCRPAGPGTRVHPENVSWAWGAGLRPANECPQTPRPFLKTAKPPEGLGSHLSVGNSTFLRSDKHLRVRRPRRPRRGCAFLLCILAEDPKCDDEYTCLFQSPAHAYQSSRLLVAPWIGLSSISDWWSGRGLRVWFRPGRLFNVELACFSSVSVGAL